MRDVLTILVTCFLLAAGSPVASLQAQHKLNPTLSREMALENNKQMGMAAEKRKMATFEVKAYRANYMPKISATGNYLLTTASVKKSIPETYLPTFVPDANGQLVPNILTTVDGVPIFKEYAYFPGMELSLKPNNTYIAGLRLEQPIYTGGKITSAYRMAKLGVEMARLNEEKTRAEVIVEADVAYWTYVEALELEKTAHTYKELLTQLHNDVENAFNAGMVPRNNLLKVDVKLNEADLQLMRAENGVRLSRMNLCHVVGLPLYSDVEVEDSSVPEELAEVPLPDLASRPEYDLLTKQIKLKELQTVLVKSDFLPRVGVAGIMGYANGLELNGNKLLNHTALSALVSVSVPIFHWGEGRNKVRAAESERQMAALQRDQLEEKMSLEIEQSLQSLTESQARVVLTTRSLGQAEENLRESNDRYKAGMETLSSLLEAQVMWQQAYTELVRASSSARVAETRYLKAAGRL